MEKRILRFQTIETYLFDVRNPCLLRCDVTCFLFATVGTVLNTNKFHIQMFNIDKRIDTFWYQEQSSIPDDLDQSLVSRKKPSAPQCCVHLFAIFCNTNITKQLLTKPINGVSLEMIIQNESSYNTAFLQKATIRKKERKSGRILEIFLVCRARK